MCDTIVAVPGSTAQALMLFGKNSDRQRNEAQVVEHVRGCVHAAGTQSICTYITIPQVRRTNSVLICRPFWMWGAEMGANDQGVVIGNEALIARRPVRRESSLTGMDLLRLALERASTAAEAVDVITALLGQYGQGGNCGHLTPSYYNNGFLIADAEQAFVVETVDREWLVERVHGVRAISNRYSVGTEAQRVSAGLHTLLRSSGWSTDIAPNYADVLADPAREHIGSARERSVCSTSLLRSRAGHLGVSDFMSILRDHGLGQHYHPEWRDECVVRQTVCMHAGADDRPGQTVGSMVSEVHRKGEVHWLTGTAAPCMSIFKPVFIDQPIPWHGPHPIDRFDPRTLWWQHEQIHRAALVADIAGFLTDIRDERNSVEADFQALVIEVLDGGNAEDRSRAMAECWSKAIEIESSWFSRINRKPFAGDGSYTSEWIRMNRLAGLDMHLQQAQIG
jgi:secernin